MEAMWSRPLGSRDVSVADPVKCPFHIAYELAHGI